MSSEALLEHRLVSSQEMDAWPVDKARQEVKRWSEIAWGFGPQDGPRRLLFNFNVWPCRVVFEVPAACEVARGEAVWRRSKLSIRMKGLKLLPAGGGEEIKDAVLVHYDQERVAIDFRPTAGAGLYHLYYGAAEDALFDPSQDFLAKAAAGQAMATEALRIEARSRIDDFDAMEQIALSTEVENLLARHPGLPYLVFPEDRDRPIKLQFELPADWARNGPRLPLELRADRNEYRVFQLGIWACRHEVANATARASELRSPQGAAIPAGGVQCLTLESRIASQYILKPPSRLNIPKGQVRALWFGIDIPRDAPPGRYEGTITVEAPGLPSTQAPLRLEISEQVVPERGDHDLWRMSRLRWIESDVGLSDEVFSPYKSLRVSRDGRKVSTWGHTYSLSPVGLPARLRVGSIDVLAGPVAIKAGVGNRPVRWSGGKLKVVEQTPGHVDWIGSAADRASGLNLAVRARMEFDGLIVFDVEIRSGGRSVTVSDLTLLAPYDRANACLGTGMGYRGRRVGNCSWRRQEHGYEAKPRVWMGSTEAGLLWAMWLDQAKPKPASGAWEDPTCEDAATVTEEGKAVILRANLGRHRVTRDKPWRMQFALLPTPVKPADQRHWDFRYMHKGGWFLPDKDDTPHSYLADGCKRLEEARQYGVKRLNLHDWWGPAFNCAWQWDRPDNLSTLAKEAHRRGMFVKVYNSGREMSSFAPYFWPLLYEATQYQFRDAVDPRPCPRFQDAWIENHIPDGLGGGWVRLHDDVGTEHCFNVSNATRNGNLYLESMRYMTRFFGADGAYWDGADGPTLGFREMAKRLWTIFRQTNPNACIDVHHGHPLVSSPIVDFILCFPFIDSLWHGEGFNYDRYDPWAWLVEIAALPFNVPSEMLGGEEYVGRGMLFGVWPRYGWGNNFDVPSKLWKFFDRFDIKKAKMLGWWEPYNGVAVDKPLTYVTAYRHPRNGVLLAIATWLEPPIAWMEMTFQISLRLDREFLGLPKGKLAATDIISGQDVDVAAPVAIPDAKFGRLIWVRKATIKS
jgi:hypothetical protein